MHESITIPTSLFFFFSKGKEKKRSNNTITLTPSLSVVIVIVLSSSFLLFLSSTKQISFLFVFLFVCFLPCSIPLRSAHLLDRRRLSACCKAACRISCTSSRPRTEGSRVGAGRRGRGALKEESEKAKQTLLFLYITAAELV